MPKTEAVKEKKISRKMLTFDVLSKSQVVQAVGGTLPAGTTAQTIHHDGTGWKSSDVIKNDGTDVFLENLATVSGTDFLTVDNTGKIGTADGELLPAGAYKQTIFHNGTNWQATSILTVEDSVADNVTVTGNLTVSDGFVVAGRLRAFAEIQTRVIHITWSKTVPANSGFQEIQMSQDAAFTITGDLAISNNSIVNFRTAQGWVNNGGGVVPFLDKSPHRSTGASGFYHTGTSWYDWNKNTVTNNTAFDWVAYASSSGDVMTVSSGFTSTGIDFFLSVNDAPTDITYTGLFIAEISIISV